MAARQVHSIRTSLKSVSKTLAIMSLMIIASGSLTAHAQTKPKPKLHLLMGELSDASLKCGVINEKIETSAILVLRRNGIDISKDIASPYLWIYVVSQPIVADVCTSYVHISIQDQQSGTKRNGFSTELESIVLCARGGLTRATKSNANKTLSEQTENLLKSCLAKLDY